MNRFAALLFVASAFAAPLTAQTPTERVGAVKLVHVKDNAEDLVHAHLAIEAGSRFEPAGKKGLATLLSRMLVDEELVAWMDGRGGSISAEVELDAIRIALTCPAPELGAALGRLSAALADDEYETGEVASARAALLDELQTRASSVAGIADRAAEALLYGRFEEYRRIPDVDHVRSLTASDLSGFHRAHLGADRLSCALVGPVTEEAAREAVSTAFGDLRQVGDALPDPARPIYSPYRTFIYVVDVPDAERTELRLVAPGISRRNDQAPSLEAWSWAVNGGEESRMTREVVEPGLATEVGARFESGWDRVGTFQGSLTCPNDEVGEALQAYMNILQEHQKGFLYPSEMEAGRVAHAAHEEVHSKDAAERARRAADVALHDYPADYYELFGHFTQVLKGNYVVAALQRNLFHRRLIIVAAGPADRITEQLEYYTDTRPFTFETPESDVAAAAEVDRMFEAMGGRELWANLRGVELESELEVTQRGETNTRSAHTWRYFDSVHTRLEQSTLDDVTYVVDGSPGWVEGNLGIRTLSNLKYRKQILNTRRLIYNMLHVLALPDSGVYVELDDEERLVVMDHLGEIAWLTLDESGRPERTGYTDPVGDKAQVFESWSKSGDYLFGNQIVIPHQTRSAEGEFPRRVRKFVPNPPFDPKLFERPVGE